jgi:amino acid adenylation domain-containing protein
VLNKNQHQDAANEKKLKSGVHESFAAWAAVQPAALAVAWDGGSFSYGELNARANRLARHLRALGVGPEVVVGVLARRSPEMLVALLAVLKAGGCYLPLDPAYPEERLATTLVDAGVRLLLSTAELMAPRPAVAAAAPLLFQLGYEKENEERNLAGLSAADLPSLAGPENLAYVIYTSGSTGRPKGVEVEHRGLSNLVDWHRRTYSVTPADRATRIAGSAFDASVWEVWPYLAAGASLHLPADELLLSPPGLAAWLAREEITLCFLPTPLAEAVLDEEIGGGPQDAPLRALLTGGDRLHRGPRPEHPFGLYNHYGPTENSVVTTWCRVPAIALGGAERPPIGRPIDGVTVRLIGPDWSPVAAGEEGELWTGGLSLARGYRGRPELTAERFVPDPFAAEPGARLYRTGDLVRELPAGDLDFVGRIDFQVKVRGFRIELGEIEVALRRHPEVRDAVVLARDDGRGGKRLAGYVVPRGAPIPEADLAAFVGRTLPDYMVPTAWMTLAALPLTPNGKVDRAALPEPERETGALLAPRTAQEAELAAIFAEVLGLAQVGIDEDFFALGGHSLQATQVVSRVRARLGATLAPGALFTHPTVATLAAGALALGEDAGAAEGEDWEIRPLSRPEGGAAVELPLSFAQHRLWMAERWSPEPALYNTPFALDLAGALDVPVLQRAVAEILARHETLRATFREVDGQPVLEVRRRVEAVLPLCDLAGLPSGAREAEAERITGQEAHRAFDLARGPLLRTVLLRLGTEEHRLLALMHHVVSDDWSISVLVRELSVLYTAFAQSSPSPLPPLPVQYGDFAAWQRRWLAGPVLARQLGWWRAALAPPLPVLELATDRPRPALLSFRGARLRRRVPRGQVEALAALGRRADSSLFMVLLAAFDAMLARSTGGADVLVGSPIANRHRVEVEELIGFFVNTLPLRARVDPAAPFLTLLGEVRTMLLGAYEHQDLPFERLLEELAPVRDPSRNPLIDVMVILANALRLPERLGPDLALRVRELEVGVAKMDLSLFLEEGAAGMAAIWEYNTALFDAATIERMAARLETLLAGIAAAPESAVGELPLLTAAERAQLVAWNDAWNETAQRERPAELAGATLASLFAAQARRTPEALALVAGEARLTYAELAARAEALAGHLRRLGVGPEVPVGIFLPRRAELVVALLATHAAGGFYVPLDPAYPAERSAFMLADSACALVLTTGEVADRLPPQAAPVVRLDAPFPDQAVPAMADSPAGPGNLAYVIYTSGSTGRPKAVAIEHRSAVMMLAWARREFSDRELGGMLASTSITFDISVFEIFAPLAWGGTVILAENALALPALTALPVGIEVRVLNTVPSAVAELLRMDGIPASVETVNLAGEALSRSLVDRVYARPHVERAYNLYGPSEDTTYSTWELLERDSNRPPAIGRPLDGTQAWVLDARLALAPIGVPGEVYLGGEGLSRGYLGRPELTAERFVPSPFGASGAAGERLYRTGDLARYRPDGVLEFLGRIDHQVKVRGFRIELGEVESALAGVPGVEAAAVMAREDGALGTHLAAWVVAKEGWRLEVSSLRAALRERLPEYMVPTAWQLLAALPLTANGKVDRRALLRLTGEDAGGAGTPGTMAELGYLAPRGPVEEVVAAIFAEVLGLERVGARDDFFALGGQSLLATRVVSRLRRAFAVEPEVRTLLERPTVEALAAWVSEARRGGAPALPPILPRDPEAGAPPLSFAQERLWFLYQLAPESTLYNVPMVFRLDGPLAEGALAAALAEVERRHAVLRTVFAVAAAGAGEPVQVVVPPGRPGRRALPRVDLAGLPAAARAAEAERLAREESRRPFDLERGPVWRHALLRLGTEEHRLLVSLHHIAADGWSVEVLLRELAALYAAYAAAAPAGAPAPLAEPALQYADYAVWQRRWFAGETIGREAAYWRGALAGAPFVLDLPADRPRPPVPSHRGGLERTAIGTALETAARELARRSAATPFIVFLAAFQALLGRYTGLEDVLVGSPVAGRGQVETEGLIGLFINTLVLRGRLAGAPTFAELVSRVREAALAAFVHQELPFEKLVEELAPQRDFSRSPVFQVLFLFQDRAPATRELAPGLRLRVEEMAGELAKFDLKLALDEDGGGLAAFWEYATDLFAAATVRRLGEHFVNLLTGAVESPETRLAELPLLGVAELRQVLLTGSPPATDGRPVHERFAVWARRTPESPAVTCEGESLTFRELDERANRLARRLRRLGVGPETVVGLCCERSCGMVAALLGVLKAGGAYLPLDPGFPAERLAFQLADSGARVLVADEASAGRFPGISLPLVQLDEDWTAFADESPAPVENLAEPRHLAYVIYTSGSTGRPKGVMVEHGSLASYLDGVLARMALPDEASYATVSTLAADLGNTVIFAALATGGLLHVLAGDRLGDPLSLAEYFAASPVDVLKIVPSHLAALMTAERPERVLPRRLLVTGGEPLPWSLAERVRALAPGCRLLNHYGPTETTVGVLAFPLPEEAYDAPRRAPAVPLGFPLGATRAIVVAAGLAPVPRGVAGELLAGGPQVARGYLARPDLTAERFVPDPFSGEPGARLYRTGDLARLAPEGEIEFLGRIDHQVKIRGFRVEPGEIEAALGADDRVREALAVVRPGTDGENRLVAYVVPRAGAQGDLAAGLRRRLRESLPEALIPTAFVFLAALPLTANGKVDRQALSAAADPGDAGSFAGAPLRPLTTVEETVAGIFAQLLGIPPIADPDADFFELGGHSLLATRALSQLRRAFGIDLELRALFDERTVSRLARRIAERTGSGGAPVLLGGLAVPPAAPVGGEAGMPLSFAQQRLWFLDRLLGASATYNLPWVFRLRGPLAPAALATALNEIARRHEPLRTVFRAAEGEPVQVVLPWEPQGLPVVDLAACPLRRRDDRDGEAARLAAEWGRRPFDLERGPLFRAALLRLGADEHALLLNVHHIAADGWSREVLTRELGALYAAFAAGLPSPLPALPTRYAAYAAWQRGWLSGAVLEAELAFWRRQLGCDPEPLELPADRPRPAVQSGRGALARQALPAGFGAGLGRLGRAHKGSSFIASLAAFQGLLQRYTGRRELLVGTPVANRDRPDVEGLIGCFVNTLVLRADFSNDPPFLALLDQVRETALAAYAHQDLPFERLVEELVPGRDLSRPPLCQVTFAVESATTAAPSFGGGLEVALAESHSGTAKFDLAVFWGHATGEGTELLAEYATDLFDEATIERLLGHLAVLVAGIEADPEARISALPLLSAGERAQLVAWNEATARQRPEEAAGWTLHGMFEAQAARTPDAVALIVGEERLTYADLESRSADLALRLQSLGVGPEVPVGIFLERDADLVVALLATLRAGGFYVPMDPAYPADRIGFMLEDSGCRIVLTSESLTPKLPENGAGAGLVSVCSAQPTGSDEGAHTKEASRSKLRQDPEAVQPVVLPNNLAYLIYTSGSTGRPKAVAIEHRSAVILMHWSRREFSTLELAGMLAATSITFDMSVFELFAPLCWGGTVILAANALALPELPAKNEVRVVDTVPSAIAELLRLDALPPSVVTVNLGGEAVPRALADRIYAQAGIERLHNVYGPSEDTTFSTWELIERASRRAPAIGRPLDGTQGWVVDGNLSLTPVGVPGELCLGGGGLSRGYLGRPELTAERFVPDPFGAAGSRMYRTGDLARYRPDGRLELLGRLDHQVKIRGFRVELGEVESALAGLPGVAGAAVLARQDAALGVHLVAYVVLGAGTEGAALRDGLRSGLPEFMVPAAWKRLDALPLTPNGKVDRRALARIAPDEAAGVAGREARTPAERRLAELFAGLLGVARVGAEDNFFHLGGHSLLAARLVARVRDLFAVDLPLRTVFEAPTVAGLARWIEASGGGRAMLPRPRAAGARPPASFAQQRLWLLDRLLGATATYNIPAVFHLAGALRPAALGSALDEIVRRHQVLRTVFRVEDGQPVQVVEPAAPHGLPLVDLTAIPWAEREAEAARLAAEWGRRPFDLEGGPVFRTALLRLAGGDHALLINVHHIAFDGWSHGILVHELGVLYQAFTAGRTESPLPPLPLQYGDYAAWQRDLLSGEVLAEQLGFWRTQLGIDPEPLELPADRLRPALPSGRGALARQALPTGFGAGLERLARERRGTSFIAFLAAFQALLQRYTGRPEVLVGTPVANRDRLEVEGLIGCFVNTLVLRADLAGDPSFPRLLDQVRETAFAAYAHQDLPFERLVEELVPGRDLSRPPLCQVTFALDQGKVALPSLGDGVRVTVSSSHSGTAKFDLAVYLDRSGDRSEDGAELLAEYATDLFDEATIERLLGHLAVLVAGIEGEPEARISALPLLSAGERAQLVAWNEATRRPEEVDGWTLHGMFEAQAAKTPDTVALIVGEERLTYADLESRSADLALRLRSLGVGPEVPVGIFLDRDADLVVGLLATLRAGGFYVPMDPAYPSDRIGFMLEDSGCAVVLTSSSLAPKLPENGAGAGLVLVCSAQPTGSDEGAHTKEASRSKPGQDPEAAQPNNLAYLIYTSGSTGRPKAVAIEHRSAVILMHWSRREFSSHELAGMLAATSITFDMSVFELFAPLCWGGTVILAANALALPDLPAKHEVRVVDTVPSAIAELLRMDALPPSVVTVSLGGEPVPRALADRIYAQAGIERLYNVYGPSEDTTFSTWELIERSSERTPSIGRPLDGEQGWVVDVHLHLAPVGVPGELYLGGAGVSRGYLGRPDLTAERFVPDPFAAAAGRPGARMYRVGDLVRYRPDGRLEFLGRLDHQVKVRGFRVELGEVEAALARLPGVAAAAVLARQDAALGVHLVAYLMLAAGTEIAALRDGMRERLPEFMVPTAWKRLDALPLTPNGKVDRRALARIAPDEAAVASREAETAAERRLAELFAGLLGAERVGAEDNFFHLGGHSLLAARLVARIRDLFEIDLPLRTVFEAPTVAALACWIEAHRGERATLPLPHKEGSRLAGSLVHAPASFAQQRLWILDRLLGATATYNIPAVFHLEGALRPTALGAALDEIVRRHQVLRTVFRVEDGQPVQVVQPFRAHGLPVIDLAACPPPLREAEAARLAAEWGRRPFDLERGPVFRAALLRLAERGHTLLVNVHHIASDGWSQGILIHELSALYRTLASGGTESPLPPLPLQYGDYAAWQRGWLSGAVLEEQVGFWRDHLGMDPEPLELPADRPRPAVQSGRGALARHPLPAGFGFGLDRLGRARRATSFMVFLAAFQALLQRYTGRRELLVGTPVANRDRLEVEGLIGCFVNTLVLRADLAGDPPFGDPSFLRLLDQVRETALAAYAHQDLPFERLVEELIPGRDLSRTPLCQVTFALDSGGAPLPALGDGVRVTASAGHSGTAKFDLAVYLDRSGDGPELLAEYATDLFDGATIERLLGHLAVLVAGIEADPEARISALPLLGEEERAQLVAWNEETRRQRPEESAGWTLHGMFAAQAARTPEAVALIAGEERITYAELESRSADLAARLQTLGVGPEVPVGIFLERDANLVVALLATLQAGGFYVPLDPAYPSDRIGFMLEDSGCQAVLTTQSLAPKLPENGAGAVRVLMGPVQPTGSDEGAHTKEASRGPSGPTPEAAQPDNLAYLIYTSGSTGRPKAVAIEHRSAVILMRWSRREFSDLELSGMLAATSITFDMSVFELFAPLCWGGRVILAANALALPDLPARHLVRVVDTVPSAIAELLRIGALPPSVVTVNLGGEPVPRALAERIYAQPGIERLYNVYGPSEDTTFSTWELIERRSERAPAIGRPLDGEQGWVVDGHFNLAPVGVPGELYLGGAGVSRGYLGCPELTAERFVPDPFAAASGRPGARMYRVGDLVRYRPDGRLEFLGRIDHQVKIRGFRVEMGEVEAVLSRLAGVEEAVVLARQDAALGLHLAAFVVPEALDAAALREGARAALPDYMVPTAWKRLDALPLTPNGKVDRRALARLPVETVVTAGAGFVAPASPLEEALAGLVADLLGLERVGTADDFFLRGGHSLLAARLVARIREAFEVDLPLRAVFEAPTVAGLARRVEAGRQGALSANSPQPAPLPLLLPPPPLLPHTRHEALPASFAQQRLWFLQRLRPESPAYNMPFVFRIQGPLRTAVLAQALDEVERRHEVLRTVFRVADGQPLQVVQPFAPRPLPVVDLERFSERRSDQAAWLVSEWGSQPADLERGPILRTSLLRLSETEHLLLLDIHHIASDGWSSGVLTAELGSLYRAFAAGRPSPLEPLFIQYADYAVWQREWLQGAVLEAQLAFWRERLGVDPEPLELPVDHPRPAVQSGRGAVESRTHRAGRRLERLARERGATTFMAFLAVFQTLLHRYTGRTGISVGSPVANRGRLETEGLIGCFVNTLVLHADLAGDPTFGELLERVREAALSAYAHQDLPFERLVEELVSGRDLSRSPLCQVAFSFQQEGVAALDFGSELRVEMEEGRGGSAKFDLALFVGRAEESTELLAEYSTDLFEGATVQRLLGHFETLLHGVERAPETPLSALPLLNDAERGQLAAWNQETQRQRPEERLEESAGWTLHGMFEAQAARTPGAVALIVGEERLTYEDLDRRSADLASHLQSLGVGPEVPVGIFLERDAELVVALLATLRAGGFYVPMDPAYPSERLSFMLEDSGCRIVLTSESLAPKLPENGAGEGPVLVDPAQPTGSDEGAHTKEASRGPRGLDPGVLPGNLAYLIYTSGSTGRPKAVAIEHHSAVVLMHWSRREFSPLELGGMLAATSITFDMSVFELFAPLCWGGTVILAANALALPKLPAKEEVRVVDTVPSAIAELLRMGALPPSVVTVNLGGEAVPRALADRIYAQPGIERLYNVYGPSEDTTFSTWELIERQSERAPAIGRPLDGEQGWVVDGHFNLAPVGVPGELYLGGAGVSRGYLGRPDLTAERFVPDPFAAASGRPGARMYRVGDLVRYRPDGVLEFLGRIDHQVKIRGFRVELGEVEAALARLPGVESAAVLARQETGDTRLVAYVAAAPEASLTPAALREALRERLPEFMVPSAFVFLAALPLTPNGKVNRRALPLPDKAAETSGAEHVAPRTPLEALLAEIWSAVLGIETVGIDDAFWDLGGHSLLATRVLARLLDSTGVELPLQALFEHPTVRQLAEAVGNQLLDDGGDEVDEYLAELEGVFEPETQER